MAGDEQLAHLLKRKGGTMSDLMGVRMLCNAAVRGDVKRLNLLIKCAGLEVLNFTTKQCKRLLRKYMSHLAVGRNCAPLTATSVSRGSTQADLV